MFKPIHLLSFLVLLSAVLILSGCGGTKFQRGSDDPTLDEKAMSRKLDLKDVDLALDKLMKKFESHPFMGRVKQSVAAGGERPGISVDIILNETDQRIDTNVLLESFRTKIIGFGIYKVVSYDNTMKFKNLLKEQNSDWYNGATVPNAGNLCGFRYIIGGKLLGGTERTSDEARTQYRLVLMALDIETGVIEWQETTDITKFQS